MEVTRPDGVDRTFQYGRNAAKRAQPLPPPWKGNTRAAKGLSEFHRNLHHISERLLELFALALDVSPWNSYPRFAWGGGGMKSTDDGF